MNKERSSKFPAAHCDTVHSALGVAFGRAPVGAVTPVAGGASGAWPFRAEVGGRYYMVWLEGLESPLRNPYQYASMRIAAEAGIAPRIHYVDEVARLAVTDFIEQRPLQVYPGGRHALVQAVGELLGRLQATPVFPLFSDYPDIVTRLFSHVRRTKLFTIGLLEAHLERLEHVRAAYALSCERVFSSHNDLNPSNILFDGERLWLIDWESAYRNDPPVDVAIALDTLAHSPEL